MKKLHFLSGLPRSGSTLLGSILNKHDLIHVTPTSPIADLICMTEESIKKLSVQYTFDESALLTNTVHGIFEHGFSYTDKPIVFDKHRAWPRNLKIASSFVQNDFTGIVTYRPIPEVIVSYIKLIKKDPDNFIDNHLRKDGRPLNTRNRADYLWRYYISDPYMSVQYGLKNGKDKLLMLSYDEITLHTTDTLKRIEDFFGVSGLSEIHLENITNTCAEDKDAAWGLKDLHTIRPTIRKTSDDPVEVLGKELFDYYSQFDIKL